LGVGVFLFCVVFFFLFWGVGVWGSEG